MNTLHILFVSWGVVTAVLIGALIYRSALSSHEEDQIFLDASQNSIANEQRAIVARLEKLTVPITALMLASGALLIGMAAMWLWQGYKNF